MTIKYMKYDAASTSIFTTGSALVKKIYLATTKINTAIFPKDHDLQKSIRGNKHVPKLI